MPNRLFEKFRLDISNRTARLPIRITLIYGFIGVCWIIGSDFFWELLTDAHSKPWIQTAKGLGYVFVTAIVLYYLLRRGIEELQNYSATNFATATELSESEDRLNRAQAVANLGSWELDIKNNRLRWSDKLYEIFGITREDFDGTYEAFFARVHPDDQAQMSEAQQRALSEGKLLDTIHRIIRPNGEIRHLHEIAELMIDQEGEPFLLTGVAQDVTAKIVAANTLHHIRERLRRAIEAAGIGFWDWNIASNEVFFSDEWKAQIGYQPEEFPDEYEAWEQRIHDEDRPRVLELIKQHVEDSSKLFEVEFRLRHSDGSYRNILAQGKHDPKTSQMIGVHIDVTDHRKLQELFVQSQKMESVGRLAGGVAHDFNNLLSVIQGYSQLALDKISTENPARANLEEVLSATDRAAALTKQILAFSRRQVVRPTITEPDKLLRNLHKMLDRLISESITLVFDLDAAGTRVRIDPNQLDQVVMNLVLNAADAVESAGRIEVTSRMTLIAGDDRLPAGEYYELCVSDNGAGISAENQNSIFEPFFTTKENHRGTGLGLSTVKEIVEKNAGTIEVESGMGAGSIFRLYLPGTEHAEEISERHEPATTEQHGTETILIVEDNDSLRHLVVRMLHNAGYTTLAASNGEDALRILSDHAEIGLLLTDVVMPGLGGARLAKRARMIKPSMRVIFMTGYSEGVLTEEGEDYDRRHFIVKPFTAREVAERVREALDQSASH